MIMAAFWIGIIVGGAFAWFLIKRGFYETWVTLFNIAVAIYLAIFLWPAIAKAFPFATEAALGAAITLLVTAAVVFLLLEILAYLFFVSHFKITSPRLFDTIGSGVLGFLAGLLVWSFVLLLINIAPFSENDLSKQLGLQEQTKQGNTYLCFWCNLVNTAGARSDNKISCQQAIEKIHNQLKQEQSEQLPVTEPDSFEQSADFLPSEPNSGKRQPD